MRQDTCYEIDFREFMIWLEVKVKKNNLFCPYIRQLTYNGFQDKRVCRTVAWALQESMLEIVSGSSVAEFAGVLIDIGHAKSEQSFFGGKKVVEHKPEEGG